MEVKDFSYVDACFERAEMLKVNGNLLPIVVVKLISIIFKSPEGHFLKILINNILRLKPFLTGLWQKPGI